MPTMTPKKIILVIKLQPGLSIDDEKTSLSALSGCLGMSLIVTSSSSPSTAGSADPKSSLRTKPKY